MLSTKLWYHHMTGVVSKLTWSINSFLNINVLAGEFLYFSFYCVLHEMLWLSLNHTLEIFLRKLWIIELTSDLLPCQIWWRLHTNALPICLNINFVIVQLWIGALIYVVSVLASRVCKPLVIWIVQNLSSFPLDRACRITGWILKNECSFLFFVGAI